MTMVTLPRATLQQALEALDRNWDGCVNSQEGEAITALRAALSQQEQEQEPVAWMAPNGDLRKDRTPRKFSDWGWRQEDYVPLYTRPSRREWRSLSKEEIMDVLWSVSSFTTITYARAIEAALKEKNHE